MSRSMVLLKLCQQKVNLIGGKEHGLVLGTNIGYLLSVDRVL